MSTRNLYYSIISFEIVLALFFWVIQPNPLIPTPTEIGHAFSRLANNQGLFAELFTSIGVCFLAMTYSFIISLCLVYLGEVKFGSKHIKIFNPIVFFITKLRFMTLVGLGFVFTLYTPDAHALKIAMLTFGMSVFFITSAYDVVSKVESYEYIHARTLGKSELGVLWEVIILGKFHLILDAFRQNFAIVWTMITLVEGIVRSDGGIGAMLLNENKSLHLDGIFAIQFLILTAGILQDYAFGFIQSIVTPYANLSQTK